MNPSQIKFISYDGKYPCLCMGNLILEIDGKQFTFTGCLTSGGYIYFDNDWNDFIEHGPWSVRFDNGYLEFNSDSPVPTFLYFTEEEQKIITKLVNENVPWGCCGGCI